MMTTNDIRRMIADRQPIGSDVGILFVESHATAERRVLATCTAAEIAAYRVEEDDGVCIEGYDTPAIS